MERKINDSNSNDKKAGDVKLSEPISLIGELSKKITDKTSPYFPKDDIPKGEKLVLQCLINKDGVTQLDIVRFTGFKPPTISIMLHKMEDEGLVTRKPDEYDLRAMRVYITDDGRAEYSKAVKIVNAIESKLMYNITDEEKRSLESVLKKIKSNLDLF